MKTFRAILIGTAIWILGVSLYSVSFYVPLMDDLEQQANMVLFLVVMPLVWAGSALYYKKDRKTHGLKVGQAFLLTSVGLDAAITVPFLMIPNGIDHYAFFTSMGFWIIAIEFLLVVVLFYYTRVYPKTINLK